ncbi:MAG: SWIM zinc finger family protein [Chitinophagaceae bacterium]
MQLTEEQILALAPDEASKKAGKDLSNLAKWVSKGCNEEAIWGECQGSGSKPYQTQIDVAALAFKCSCPSRKFPCKHGIGLLLLNAKYNNTFTNTTPPAWVKDWLDKRTEKAEKKAEQKDKPVDEAAQAKRSKAREQLIEDGIEDILLWMKDVLRNGIINIPEKGTADFDAIAKRMIDAKAPGLAAMIKALININYYQEGWQHLFINQISRIYLVISGFKNKATINPVLFEDIKTAIGFTQSQEELKTQSGIKDHWLVIGKKTNEEDNITTERNWLYGINTQTYALVLQFSVRGQGITFSLTPGMMVDAELVFYPSVKPLRAIIKNYSQMQQNIAVKGFAGWQHIVETQTEISADLPFFTERPYIVQQLMPVNFDGKWCLKDATDFLMQMPDSFLNHYKLLAISGGKPLDMAVKGRENIFEPIGVWAGDQYISL